MGTPDSMSDKERRSLAVATCALYAMRYDMDINPGSGEFITACRHVLGFTHQEFGYEAGSFTQALIDVLFKADQVNLRRLADVYPELVLAVAVYRDNEDGLAVIQEIAKPGTW